MSDRGSLEPKLLARPVLSATIPEAARAFPDTDVKTFKMRAPTLQNEIDAARAAALQGGTDVSLKAEVIRRCVFEINGVEVKDFDWLEGQSQQVRMFLDLAMAKLTSTGLGKEETDAFLAGMSIGIG